MAVLVRSPHVSWFAHAGAVYAYHDMFGYLLEMSPDLKALVDFFAAPATAEDAALRFEAAWSRDQIGQFLSVFLAQRIVAPVGSDDEALLPDRVPIKGPWILALRGDRGEVRAVRSRGFGGEAWAAPETVTLDAFEAALWLAIDGERTVRDLAWGISEAWDGDVAADLARAVDAIGRWTHHACQWTRVLDRPKSQLARLPSYATSTMPYPPQDAAPVREDARRDLTAYHQDAIADAEFQFEEAETTLSHLFSDPHPALGDRTWGEAFAARLREDGVLTADTTSVVEVGGGTGRFAAAFFTAASQEAPRLRHTVIELSPALHAAQVARLAPLGDRVASRLGDARHLDLADASVDVLVSNEVIADLAIGMVSRAALASGEADAHTDADALAVVRRYDLPTTGAPEPVPIQTGATRFIEEIARVLRPGGAAALTEFGAENRFPIASTHLDHVEWSVHFGHLAHVARALGLHATIAPLPEWIGLRADVWVLACNRTQFRNLRYLARVHGGDLSKRALTPEQLAVALGGKLRLDRLEGVQFRPAGERVMGLVPSEFLVIVLRKPGP